MRPPATPISFGGCNSASEFTAQIRGKIRHAATAGAVRLDFTAMDAVNSEPTPANGTKSEVPARGHRGVSSPRCADEPPR